MGFWGDGYRQGYRNALYKYAWWKDGIQYVGNGTNTLKQAMDEINKDVDGSPSRYAVANKCCGGVDAHDVGCR